MLRLSANNKNDVWRRQRSLGAAWHFLYSSAGEKDETAMRTKVIVFINEVGMHTFPTFSFFFFNPFRAAVQKLPFYNHLVDWV